jgi:hypothetical protein
MRTGVDYALVDSVFEERDGRELDCLFDVESRLHNVLEWPEFEFGFDSTFFNHKVGSFIM